MSDETNDTKKDVLLRAAQKLQKLLEGQFVSFLPEEKDAIKEYCEDAIYIAVNDRRVIPKNIVKHIQQCDGCRAMIYAVDA